MPHFRGRIDLRPGRLARLFVQRLKLSPNWAFASDVARLIWEFRLFSLAVFFITVAQEFAALWPVNLLGQFVDRLGGNGELGDVVLRFLGATLLYPGLVRGNVILRHKLFYQVDFRSRVELTLRVADRGDIHDAEKAGSAHTRLVNAVSGITNAMYHLLGSFTPVIVKIVVVSGNLLAYNRTLGLTYLASLTVPFAMTIFFNQNLQVLRDAQYSVVSDVSGVGIRTISERDNTTVRERFLRIMADRRDILTKLLTKSQCFIYARQVALIGGQFLTIFLALGLREELGLTPGDFTKIVGYTTQVAGAFIGTASVLDAIVSYSRAYHVYAQVHGS